MPSRYDRMERLKAVEREYLVVRSAVDRLRMDWINGAATLPEGTSPRDVEGTRDQLEATFLIRLCAEFETAVRLYHGWTKGETESTIRTRDLIDTVFASRQFKFVSEVVRRNVHEVREYRNALVHEREDEVLAIGLSEARRRLNIFLGAKLPERWG